MTSSKNICLCCLSQKCKAAHGGTKRELQLCQEAFKIRQKVSTTLQTRKELIGSSTHLHVAQQSKHNLQYSHSQHAILGRVALHQHVAHRAGHHPALGPSWTKTQTNKLADVPGVSKSSKRETSYSLCLVPEPSWFWRCVFDLTQT